jgi:hypothetical protein
MPVFGLGWPWNAVIVVGLLALIDLALCLAVILIDRRRASRRQASSSSSTTGRIRRLGVVVLVALAASSCSAILVHVPRRCADGLPAKLFQDPRCPPRGICGFTCAPDRWIDELALEASELVNSADP